MKRDAPALLRQYQSITPSSRSTPLCVEQSYETHTHRSRVCGWLGRELVAVVTFIKGIQHHQRLGVFDKIAITQTEISDPSLFG